MERLHPAIRTLLQKAAEKAAPSISTLTPAQARADRNPVLVKLAEPAEQVAKLEESKICGQAHEIPVRIYTPAGQAPFPALIYFHGGGWVIGTLDTHDSICRALANGAGCVVVSVDYRLAPEHKFPAAVEDAYRAVNWVADHSDRLRIDPNRLAVGGDSAGANLATVAALMVRDQGGPALSFQLLVYPPTNVSSFETRSHNSYAEKYLLKKSEMTWFRDHYLTTAQERRHPHVSPLLAPDLSGLPPALIMTAEYDILTDDGQAYAERLKQARVPATYRCFKGMIHLFWGMGRLERSENGIGEAIAALRLTFKE